MVNWGKVREIIEQVDDVDDLLAAQTRLGTQALGQAWDRVVAPVGRELIDSTHPKEWVGDIRYANARYGLGALPENVGSALAFDPMPGGLDLNLLDTPDEYARVREAHDKGYNGFTGGRAVWEQAQGDKSGIERFGFDVAVDPTTLLTAGGAAAGKALIKQGAKTAAKPGFTMSAAGTFMKGTGRIVRIVELPDFLADKAVAPVLGRIANTRPGQWISGLSPRETIRRDTDRLYPILKLVSAQNKSQKSYNDALALGKQVSGNTTMVDDIDPQSMATNILNLKNSPMSNKAITEHQVGSRVFERGPFANQTIADAAEETFANVRAMKDFLAQHQVQWERGFTPGQINNAIKGKLTKDERLMVMEWVDDYKGAGLDPLWNTEDQLLAKKLADVKASDPTVASLAEEENAMMFDQPFTVGPHKGKSKYQAFVDIENELLDDRLTVQSKAGQMPWKPGTDRDTIRDITKQAGVQKIYNKWAAEGVDILHTPVEEGAFQMLKKNLYAEGGLESSIDRGYLGALANVWKGTALFSPRYHLSNLTGNYFNTLITHGPGGFATPEDYYKQVKLMLDNDPNLYNMIPIDSPLMKNMEDYGIVRHNINLVQSGLASTEQGVNRSAERVFGRIIGKSASRSVGRALDWNRRLGAGTDAAARTVLWDTKFRALFNERLPMLEDEVRKAAAKERPNLPADVALLPFRDPEKLLGYYKGLGFKDGTARRLSRNVAEVRNTADKEAIAAVHKSMFSYYRTPLDELVSKVVPFHYYASRSTLLYFETMARNPIIAINVARMGEELFRDYKNSGLNARQKGWLHVMSGLHGYSLLMNPDALLGFTRAMGLMGDNYESDETSLGGILRWMKAGGYGMYPWVDGMFNMMGAYGDTFEPDMLGIRHRALVGSLVNSAAAELGFGEAGMQAAPYAELNAKAREHVSTWAAAFMPGWMSQPVRAKANDTGTIAEASMEKLIESRIIHNNPGITNEQLFEIMNDPDNEQLQQAWEDVTRAGVANQLMAFTFPVGIKVRDADTDVRSAKLSVTYDYADKLGIAPGDVSPQSSAEFGAAYKRQTGKEWKPTDFDQAQLEQTLTTATPKARPFLIQLEQYNELGSPQGKKVFDTYNKIKYGELVPSGYAEPPPGDQDAAELLAETWLAQQSGADQAAYTELRQLRGLFEVTNPQFGEFKNWQGQMSYLRSLLGGDLSLYRERIAAGNPNAAAYFDRKRRDIIRDGITDPEKIRAEMDRITTTPDAWLAITGTAKSRSQPSTQSTSNGGVFDPQQPMIEQAQTQQPAGTTPGQPQGEWGSFLQGYG